MINPQLLKKGSHVRVNESDYQINTIKSETVFEATLLPGGPPEDFSIDDLHPIPISDEYLLAYKVKKNEDGTFISRGNIIYRQVDGTWTVLTKTSKDNFETHSNLNFIHELQFYSMENTGEDLNTFGQF